MSERYDVIVIGSGQGGGPLARRLAQAGRRVALVERAHVGGTCINEGCTPTKTMVASARIAYMARRSSSFGVETNGTGGVSVDLARVRARKQAVVERFRRGSESSFLGTENLDLVYGSARFTAPHEVEIDLNDGGARRLGAPTIVIDVGTRPATPPVAGLDTVPFLTNRSVMELEHVPDHLVVLGGGYVGVEFAQMFRRFGSRVTLVHRGPQILAQEDRDVADALASILEDEGVDVRLEATIEAVGPADSGVRVQVRARDGVHPIDGSHLLVATGRRPNTDGLGLEHAGIALDAGGFVPVGDRLRTAVEGIYAIGDVTGGPAFTHTSYDDYRILVSDWLGDGAHPGRSDRVLAYTVYSDPQLGRVGMTEAQARRAGREIRTASLPMEHVARAIETDDTRGFMKAVVDADSDRILGAAVLGPEGGELAATLQVAMLGDLPYTVLRDAPLAHPTYAESLNSLFSAL